jgi:hypothetical protein
VPPALTVVVVARAVYVVVVDALSLPTGFYGVSGVAVGPETTLDCRYRGSDSFFSSLLLGRRWIRVVGRWRSSPPTLRALARGGALRLLRRRCFKQRLQLLAHSPLLGGCRLRAAAQQHGRGDKVLGRPPEKLWCVGVRAPIGASVVVGLRHTRGQRRCTAALQLVGVGAGCHSPHGARPA